MVLKNDSSKSVQKLTEEQQQKHKISLFGQKFKYISQEKEITWNNFYFFLKTFKSETDRTMHACFFYVSGQLNHNESKWYHSYMILWFQNTNKIVKPQFYLLYLNSPISWYFFQICYKFISEGKQILKLKLLSVNF